MEEIKLNDVLLNINKFTLDELNKLKVEITKNIELKNENKNEKVIYWHECSSASSYHLRKYRHWMKVLTAIDDTKTNGYAFIGDFLSMEKENLVEVGKYVIEVCDNELYLYQVIKDEQEDNKKFITKSDYAHFISFIQKIKEITKL